MDNQHSQRKTLSLNDRLAEVFSMSWDRLPLHERVVLCVQRLIRDNRVSTEKDPRSLLAHFQATQTPLQSQVFESYIEYLEKEIVPHSVNVSSPKCIGHMSSVLPNFVSTLSVLITLLNQNLAKREASKAFTLVERQVLGMMHRVVYNLPEDFYLEHVQDENSTLGIMSSGGTLANITALWIARNSCFGPTNDFAGVEEEGMSAALQYYGYDAAVVIGSELMHYSIDKAASLLGLGARNTIKLPVDERYRLDLRQLQHAITQCGVLRRRVVAVIGIAGSTDCGSVDQLSEIAQITQGEGIHFHVDAAWGAPLLFSRKHRCKLAGIERAQSVTVDGHKQMYLPMGTSMLLLREPRAADVIKKGSRYMLQEGSGDLGRYSVQGSRSGTALFVHAALHIIGKDGYEFIVDENIRKTGEMASTILNQREFELLVIPETNILLYRYVPIRWREALRQGQLTHSANEEINDLNEKLQKAEFQAGRSFVSRTKIDKACEGKRTPLVVLRAVFGNPFTNEMDFHSVLEDQAAIAAQLDPG